MTNNNLWKDIYTATGNTATFTISVSSAVPNVWTMTATTGEYPTIHWNNTFSGHPIGDDE